MSGSPAHDGEAWLPRAAGLVRRVIAALALFAALAARAASPDAGLLGARIDAPPLAIHHHPEQARLAADLAARGPADVARIALSLGVPVPDLIDVYLVPSRAGDPRVHGLPGAPDWAAGYALIERPEIVLRTTQTHGPTGNDAATVFTHELVHSLVANAVGARRHDELPAWFVEGIASHLAHEWRLVHSAHVAGLALSGRYVPLRQLEQRFPLESSRAQLAYLEAFAFVDWLAKRSGEDALRRLLDDFRAGASFDDAFREAFGEPWSDLEARWRTGFLVRHRWVPIVTSSATLWAVVTALLVAGGVLKRRRVQAVLDRWEEEERQLWPEGRPFVELETEDDAAPAGGDPRASGPESGSGDERR